MIIRFDKIAGLMMAIAVLIGVFLGMLNVPPTPAILTCILWGIVASIISAAIRYRLRD